MSKKIINKGGIVQLLKCLVAKAFFPLPSISVQQLNFNAFLCFLSPYLQPPGARLSLFAGIPSKLHPRSKNRNLRASDTLTNPRLYQYLTHALSPCTSESGLLACEQALYLRDTVKSHAARESEGNETTVESRLLLWTPANTDTLLLRTVFFAPGESPHIFSKFNPLNTDTRKSHIMALDTRYCLDYEWSPIIPQRNASARENHPTRERRDAVGRAHFSPSPSRLAVLAWDDLHGRSRFARSTISEEKWPTTRSQLLS